MKSIENNDVFDGFRLFSVRQTPEYGRSSAQEQARVGAGGVQTSGELRLPKMSLPAMKYGLRPLFGLKTSCVSMLSGAASRHFVGIELYFHCA